MGVRAAASGRRAVAARGGAVHEPALPHPPQRSLPRMTRAHLPVRLQA